MRRHLLARFDGDKAERARNKFNEIVALIDARDRASHFAESGRKATRRMMYSIIIRPEEIGIAKGKRRGNRETKKPKDENIKSITAARSQKTAGWQPSFASGKEVEVTQ
jgi:hypothetical protein